MDYKQRLAEAVSMHEAGMSKVRDTPCPAGQKFPPGTRVRIADDLGDFMSHFESGCMATVLHTYAHAYGGDDISIYSLDIDGVGEVAWYYERQLTLVEERR